jgi:maltodextrin utilization protein YvdJ
MFLVRYFKYSFQFDKMFIHLNEKFWKYLIYFFILSMINLFPMNFLIVKEQGWRLDFIEESLTSSTPNWQLPETWSISGYKLITDTTTQHVEVHDGITYIFNFQGTDYDLTKKQIIFKESTIIYTNGDGARMVGYDYRGFADTISFLELNLSSGEERSQNYARFGQYIEESFGSYIVFYTLLVNTMTNMALNILFILILSLVIQLFRFGFSKFLSYKEGIKFLILVMGLPAILSFIVGLMEPAFSPVLFQFGMGLTTMIVLLIHGRKYFA